MTIGERIKEKRLEKRMSLERLANAAGVARQTIYKYENNLITNIPTDKIEAIAKVLNVSPGYLMGWDEERIEMDKISPFFSQYKYLDIALIYLRKLNSDYAEMIAKVNKLNDEALTKIMDYINDLSEIQKYNYAPIKSYITGKGDATGYYEVEYDDKGNIISEKKVE